MVQLQGVVDLGGYNVVNWPSASTSYRQLLPILANSPKNVLYQAFSEYPLDQPRWPFQSKYTTVFWFGCSNVVYFLHSVARRLLFWSYRIGLHPPMYRIQLILAEGELA